MKVLRIIATVVLVIVVLVALVIGVALIPSVQTWAVRKAMAHQAGMRLEIAQVSAGLTAADLRDLHLENAGMTVTASHVAARYSVWDFLAQRKLHVDDLTAEGLVIDARGAASSPTPAGSVATPQSNPSAPSSSAQPGASQKSEPFNGVLNQIHLPFQVDIARFYIPGRVLLPNSQTATFELRGSSISTGKRGTVDWKIDVASTEAKSRWTALHSSGSAGVHITTEQRIDEADINALATAEGPQIPADQIKIEAKAEQPTAGGNEGYNAKISLTRDNQTAQLMTLAAQYDASAHEISGAWDLSVHQTDVQDLLTGLGLPDLTLIGDGKFSSKPAAGAASASGEIQADISHLEKFTAELGDVGRLHVQIHFDGNLADNIARLEQLALSATTADGRHLAEITALQRVGFSLADKRVTFANAQGDLARISVQNLPLAWARPWVKSLQIDSGDISCGLAIAATPDGSQIRITSLEPLAVHNATIRSGNQPVFDHLTLSAKPQLTYSADHIQAQIPDLNASMATGDTVNGKITVDVRNPTGARSIDFTADTQARVVAALKPYLPADAAPLTVVSSSQGNMTGNLLRFDRSTESVSRSTGSPILRFELRQPLTIDTAKNTFSTARPDATTAQIQVNNVPLAWAAGFVKGATLGGELAAGTLEVTLRSVTDLAGTTSSPISIRGATVTMNGKPLLQNLDALIDFTGSKRDQKVTFDLRSLELTQGSSSLAQVAASGEAQLGTKPTIQAKGTIKADFAALMKQPTVASYASLAGGNLNATFAATISNTVQAHATLTASDLVASADHRPLGTARLELTADVQSDGSSVLRIPFSLTNGSRSSDFTLDGKLARSGNSVSFTGSINSNQLVLDDLQPLASLAPTSQPGGTPMPAATEPAARPTPAVPVVSGTGSPAPATSAAGSAVGANGSAAHDTQPFWGGFGGNVRVDLKRILYGRDFTITNVTGTAVATLGQLALRSLQGQLKGNPFTVAATIDFNGGQPQPYTMNGTANFTNVDIGAILQAANPGEPPKLETKVSVNAKLNGQGTTAGNLAQNLYGVFDVSGSQGVLRALAGKVGKASNLLSGGLALIGALQNNSQGWDAAADLTRLLSDMPFDRFTMHVERGQDLNLNVSRIEFLSPIVHLQGSGSITNQSGVPIQNQPMKFTLQLGAKDAMAVPLQRLNLLGAQQDNLGYSMMSSSFTLSGTPAKPNSNDLWRIVGEAAARAAAGRFLGQ